VWIHHKLFFCHALTSRATLRRSIRFWDLASLKNYHTINNAHDHDIVSLAVRNDSALDSLDRPVRVPSDFQCPVSGKLCVSIE
jgi:hypothetical protein